MKVSKIEIDSREALNRLAQPVFFGPAERQNAYDIIMRTGTPTQKKAQRKRGKSGRLMAQKSL